MKKQDYISLIAKGLTNEINLQEAETLKSMRESDQSFSSTYDELQEIWDAAGAYTPNVTFNSATAYDKFAAKYEIPTDYTNSSTTNFKRVLISAVIAALLISSSVFVYFNNNANSLVNDSTKMETHAFNESSVKLSPGAEVSMDKNGAVDDIVGSAYFENSKDITINLDEQAIVTNGATFNLSKAEGSNKLRIDIKDGTMTLKGKDGNTEDFTQNNSIIYDINRGSYQLIDATESNNYLLWASNKLSFNYTSIDVVFQEMEQFFGVKIDVDGIIPSDCHFTAPIIQKASVSSVFELLRTSFNFSVTQTGNGEFEVSSLTCK